MPGKSSYYKLWTGKNIFGKSVAPRANVRAFSTAEKTPPSRRRFVSHTPQFNDSADVPLYSLPNPGRLMKKVKKFAYAYQVDFKFYFAQFLLPDRLQSVFLFRDAGRWWQLNTIPTGASSCPIIAQLFSESLTALLLAEFKNIDADAYVDNVRILANDLSYLKVVLKRFFEICDEYRVEINESYDEVITQQDGKVYDFLGVHYNHNDATTCISSKLKLKLLQGVRLLTECSPQQLPDISLRTLTSMLGVVQHAGLISGGCKSSYYHVMKFFRRRAAAGWYLDDAAQLWPSIMNTLKTWLWTEAQKQPRVWKDEAPYHRTAVIYTDASTIGMGAVMFCCDGSISIIAKSWSMAEKPHINILEAIAVRDTLKTFRLNGVDAIHLRVDNTSVIYSLQKTRSKSFDLNMIVGHITEHESWKKVISTSYVTSNENRSDLLSRLANINIHMRFNNPLFGALLKPDQHV